MKKILSIRSLAVLIAVLVSVGISVISCSEDDDGNNNNTENNGGDNGNNNGGNGNEFSPQQIVGKWKLYATPYYSTWERVDENDEFLSWLYFNSDGTFELLKNGFSASLWDQDRGEYYVRELCHYLWEIKGEGTIVGNSIVSGTSYKMFLKGNPNGISNTEKISDGISMHNLYGSDLNDSELQFYFQNNIDTLIIHLPGSRMYVREK